MKLSTHFLLRRNTDGRRQKVRIVIRRDNLILKNNGKIGNLEIFPKKSF